MGEFVIVQCSIVICHLKTRRKRDSNPRDSFPPNGFQDRRLKPLGHSSAGKSIRLNVCENTTSKKTWFRRPRRKGSELHDEESGQRNIPAVLHGIYRCCNFTAYRLVCIHHRPSFAAADQNRSGLFTAFVPGSNPAGTVCRIRDQDGFCAW